MIDASYLTWAFLAGAAATVNPCGIAMLPAYISYYLGQKDGSPSLIRGLGAGLVLSAGTFFAFILMGVVVATAGTAIARYIPWLALLVAILLLFSGVMTLIDRAPTLNLRLGKQAPQEAGLRGFFNFGIGYGFASLGCTLPIFMIVVSSAVSTSFLKGLLAFVAYGSGMALVLTGVSFAVAVGKTAVIRWLQALSPALKYIGGFGLLIAGSYLLYYNLRGITFMVTGARSDLALYAGVAAFILSLVAFLVLRSRFHQSKTVKL